VIEHDERRLPKWAQARLQAERVRCVELKTRLEIVEKLHALTVDHEWFTLIGPSFDSEIEIRNLYVLDRNVPNLVCTLGCGDKLFVGRAKPEERRALNPVPEKPSACPSCGHAGYVVASGMGLRLSGQVCPVCSNPIMEAIL
jgi:hypothetical protein